ncbi:MAG TPA: hypothetical protein PKL29_00140 [Methanothrix sp.]|nr:hypothetical protein [Methanothrix sp.]HPT36675.1 hypothetical protein [Methanothrix sp.]
MSFRPRDTLLKLADAGVDPDSLLILERHEKVDYIELGLPSQIIAKVLQIEGVLMSKGKKRINYHKQRSVWGRGPHYSVLRDHYKKNRMEFRTARGLPL